MYRWSGDIFSGLSNNLATSNTFAITPNPVTTTLHYQFDNEKEASHEWRIINLKGQVFASSVTSTSSTIDASPFPEGIYFLIIKSGEKLGCSKFLKLTK